ncbi:transcriptional regulator, TetR family protein [Candidatus Moduliflexus flocculans]|uniref:Transcriptional regulator, TetR family protein n=1 Tax=Candidatus Moduliflexus flocculans TaxID=1499966 RepID=A0A0S6VTE4_9BACT|nr:transcriptional regulator, TetR family protein [Candidatus Moduliflexus flocculans]
MPRPKEDEREDVRALVLEKAKALFLRIGYNKITMRKIAEEIGYTPGTIYLYFKNKEEILYELHNQGFELLYQYKLNVARAANSSAFDRLREGGKTYLAFAFDHPDYYELMFNMPEPHHFLTCLQEAESGERGVTQIDYAMRSYEFLKQTILDCISEGSLPDADPDVMTFAFWSFVHGVVSLTIRKRIPYPQAASQAFAVAAIDFFMHIIHQQLSHTEHKELS